MSALLTGDGRGGAKHGQNVGIFLFVFQYDRPCWRAVIKRFSSVSQKMNKDAVVVEVEAICFISVLLLAHPGSLISLRSCYCVDITRCFTRLIEGFCCGIQRDVYGMLPMTWDIFSRKYGNRRDRDTKSAWKA